MNTTTPTIQNFAGCLYDHKDAMRRVPQAWRMDLIKGDGWQREEVHCIAPKTLGHWERLHKTWVYVEPNGYARPVNENYGLDTPPPLPRIGKHRQCGCGEVHTCSSCGQPFWIELHGVADGYCTYCYHAG